MSVEEPETPQTLFQKEMESDSAMIEDAILNLGSVELLEDKTIDLVAAIVANKLRPFFSDKAEDGKKSQDSSTDTILKFAVVILTIVFLGLMIYTTLENPNPNAKQKEEDFSNIKFEDEKDQLVVGPFEFKRGNLIKISQYDGRVKEVAEHEKLIMEVIEGIQYAEKTYLDKENIYAMQNFLLEGPPGTGKTIFVRYIATKIDAKLKVRYLESKDCDKKLKEEYIKLKNANDPEKLKTFMDKKVRSRIIMCDVMPSSINNMYQGESEKNVRNLFTVANKLGEEDNTAVFLFFDEGDVFFEERSSGASGSGAANVKSELLNKIGVEPKTRYYNVFTYCATNRPSVFDDAFKRRFGIHNRFDAPAADERRSLLKCVFKDYETIKEEVYDTMVELTAGKSHSFITGQMKSFYIKKGWKVTGFKLKKYVEHLNRNRNNTSLG